MLQRAPSRAPKLRPWKSDARWEDASVVVGICEHDDLLALFGQDGYRKRNKSEEALARTRV
jgi:hypothetical protein